MNERWGRLPVAARVIIAVIALLVGLNVLLAGIDLASGGPPPGGPTSSSYATGADGLAAYADLLADHGHPVRRLRENLDDAGLDPGTTVVVADPVPLTGAENLALRRFVEDGGRLIAAGSDSQPSLRRILGRAPVWSPEGVRVARPLAPAPEVVNVGVARSSGGGSWKDAGATLPVLAGAGADEGADSPGPILATVATVGRGRVVALADASMLHNDLLATADNAAFAVAAAGEPGRPVAFAEAPHGYGLSEGLGAIPRRWQWALAGLLAATLAWMWSRGRRLGPAEEQERPLPPPRRVYVDAMAASLAKTRQPAVCAQPLQASARARVARRAGLPADADDAALREAARHLGLPEEQIAALFAPPRNDRDLLAVGRAVAGLEDGGRQW